MDPHTKRPRQDTQQMLQATAENGSLRVKIRRLDHQQPTPNPQAAYQPIPFHAASAGYPSSHTDIRQMHRSRDLGPPPAVQPGLQQGNSLFGGGIEDPSIASGDRNFQWMSQASEVPVTRPRSGSLPNYSINPDIFQQNWATTVNRER